MKWLRRILWIAVISFIVLMAISRLLGWVWGRDVESLDVKTEKYSFSATRDAESGVWKVKADSKESLWFAMGYVQTWDREYQTELVRLAARGELARMLGEAVLSNDRLMRFSARLAQDEWETASDDLKLSAQMFVLGRGAAQKNPDLRLPFEYEILGLTRESFSPWEPKDVLALSRFHSWQLSFDSTLEALDEHLRSKVSPEAAHLLLPSEPTNSKALYSQEWLYKGTDAAHSIQRMPEKKLPRPDLYWPKKTETSSVNLDSLSTQASSLAVVGNFKSIKFDWDTQLALRGASNLWIVADPRVDRALTLCNDTHLRFSWPASLYPFQYELKDQMKATGFMLPGVPAIVIGSFEDQRDGKKGNLLSWGITLASYGDTQDLVAMNKNPIDSDYSKIWESYPVRNMENGQIEIRRFEETWTSYGPRVDGIYSDLPKDDSRWLALDWVGFRKLPSPMEFFVRRNLKGADDLLEDLHTQFAFPSFNYTWIQKSGGGDPYIGHLVTGWMRTRSDRAKDGLKVLSQDQIKARRQDSEPSQRPFFYRKYTGQDPFFLVTANQKVWTEDDLSLKIAHSWEPGDRALRIEASVEENIKDPSHSMTDSYAPSLVSFYKGERARTSVDRLCGGLQVSSSRCMEWVSKLDSWKGYNPVESWQTTVVALWHAKFKAEIFMSLVPEEHKEELKSIMKDWHRRSFSAQALKRILAHETGPWSIAEWEKLTQRNIKDLSVDSFQWALNVLIEQRGAEVANWRWGAFHRISWLHPLVRAPEPWGSLFHESLFGPRPSVAGGVDSPGRFEYDWDMDVPLEFPATHGASLRMCSEFSKSAEGNPIHVKWSAPSGPSGNPFSKHAKSWSLNSFFKGKMSEAQ